MKLNDVDHNVIDEDNINIWDEFINDEVIDKKVCDTRKANKNLNDDCEYNFKRSQNYHHLTIRKPNALLTKKIY